MAAARYHDLLDLAAVYAPHRIEAQHSSCQKRKERHENKRSARAAPTAFGRHRGGDRLGIHVRGFIDALWCSRLAEGIQLQLRNNALWHARRILQSQLDLPRCGIGKKIARNLLGRSSLGRDVISCPPVFS